jgi:hypothetical protein
MVASSFLLAGLGSVMMIARQVAYTPTAANRRIESANVVNQIAEELRSATIVLQQTSQILEFVVADRNNDGAAEKIRYEWSGTVGDPLYKTINTSAAVAILESVNAFQVTLSLKATTKTLTTTTETNEIVLASNATLQSGTDCDITATKFAAQLINPATFSSIPANAIAWNATKIDFYGKQEGGTDETLLVQLRAASSPDNSPTSNVLGQVAIPESSLSGGTDWNTATLASPLRGLGFHRFYDIVWAGIGPSKAARLRPNNDAASGVFESTDGGGTWTYNASLQMFYRLYGTYTVPGPSYNVTRNFVAQVGILLQSGPQPHSRIDSQIPLINLPELLSLQWRADFDTNPVTANANGDSVPDWVYAGSGSFNSSSLIGGVWYASGALQTRPLSDFTTTTFLEARCRNTTVGGNGAVVRINADRQGGQYAPLLVYVTRQADGSQTLSLNGKTSDAATKVLCSRTKLSSGFIRFRLTILPQNNVVNLAINDEDQGTFTYPTYTPSSATDRYVTISADTSQAEFDSIDVRVQ